jgi:hypothetical protein
MKRVSASVAIVLVLAFLIPVSASGQQIDQPYFQIVATVIGRSPFSGLIISPRPTSLHPELFVLRLDAASGNLKAGQYIFIRYAYPPHKEKELGLPKDFYVQRAKWRIMLRRVEGQDLPMRDLLATKGKNGEIVPLLTRVPWVEKENLPPDQLVLFYKAELGSIEKVPE